mmetsp:Transcript_2924/g.4673  ORF Transcript_2924/g.4673 Transcript_2924/m.4673 type:complete len:202 (+) Transcript_2924:106-711(+)
MALYDIGYGCKATGRAIQLLQCRLQDTGHPQIFRILCRRIEHEVGFNEFRTQMVAAVVRMHLTQIHQKLLRNPTEASPRRRKVAVQFRRRLILACQHLQARPKRCQRTNERAADAARLHVHVDGKRKAAKSPRQIQVAARAVVQLYEHLQIAAAAEEEEALEKVLVIRVGAGTDGRRRTRPSGVYHVVLRSNEIQRRATVV